MPDSHWRTTPESDGPFATVLLILFCLFLAAGLYLGWVWLTR